MALYNSTADVTHKQPGAGVGMASGWRCEKCRHIVYGMAGRKKAAKGIGYDCRHCVAKREAVK